MDLAEEGILVRKMKEDDVSSVIAIDEKITRLHRPEMWKSQIKNYLSQPKSICLIAEIENLVVGFMMASIHPWLFGVEKAGWIEILGVDPKHTAKGVGKKLGERLLEDLKLHKIKVVYTTVNWTSSDLLEFFKTLGMTKSGFITLMKEI